MGALLIRAAFFTVLVPGTIGGWLPLVLLDGHGTVRHPAGWLLIALGAAIYFWCTAQFVLGGRGTPAIFFTRPIAFLIGREPETVVRAGMYNFSRNPMYVAVLTIIAGEALLFGSMTLVWYGIVVWIFFHLVIVFMEEPHLRRTRGDSYLDYCRKVPRWLGPVHRT